MPYAIIVLLSFVAAAVPTAAETLVFPPYGHSYGIRKATATHLFMFFGPRTGFSAPMGLATVKMASRDDPSTENDDDEVVVYGVNSGRHQIIYNTSMWALAMYGKKGSGRGAFLNPSDVVADTRGNVYVVDSGNNRLVKLFNPKREVEWVGVYSGGLKDPCQASLSAEGSVYVTDPGNKRIVVFDKSGRVSELNTEKPFEAGPSMLAVADGRERWTYREFRDDRFIYCAERGGTRLHKIDLEGNVLKSRDMPDGHMAGFGAVDYYHNLWVTDKANHCIVKFDRELELLDIFGSYGKGDNQFVEPTGIAIWRRYGQVFVAEKTGAQYYWIGTKLKSHTCAKPPGGACKLELTVAEHTYVSVFKPRVADTLFYLRNHMIPPGKSSAAFPNVDGEIDSGNVVLRVEPTYSSYTYSHWDYTLNVQSHHPAASP